MKNTLMFMITFMLLTLPALAKKEPKMPCAGVAIGRVADGSFDTNYSAAEDSAIDVWILFPSSSKKALEGFHTISITLTTPNGFPYDEIDVPISTTDKRMTNGDDRDIALLVPGTEARAPLHILKDKDYKNYKHIGGALRYPIAGTPIVNNSLYGRWTAEAFLDGEDIPCADPTQFFIVP